MSLQKKIQKIIDVINNSNIEEIEVSSFWGAQKIKLSKSKSNQQSPIVAKDSIPDIPVNISTDYKNDTSDKETIFKDDSQDEKENSISDILAEPKPAEENQKVDEELEYQKAPLVGTFYLSSKPGEPAFVSVGDTVSKGQTLCIIEAMKIFNEIESDFDGEVVEILAEDESPVEFNQEIFSIRPN